MPVSVLPLPPGEEVACLLPPEAECPQVGLAEAGEGRVAGDHCLNLRVETIEPHINYETHLVPVNRIRCVLRDVKSGEKCFCWFFGDYSDQLVSTGVQVGDHVIIINPRVLCTKLKYKQVGSVVMISFLNVQFRSCQLTCPRGPSTAWCGTGGASPLSE